MTKAESIFIKDLEKKGRISETDLLPVITKEDSEGHTITFEDLRDEFYAMYREHLIGSLAISFFNKVDHALLCDGRLLLKKSYPKLFNIINAGFNQPGDPLDSFRLPDLRGKFIRGAKIAMLTRQEETEGIRQVRISTASSREIEEYLCFAGIWNYRLGGDNAQRIVVPDNYTYGNAIRVGDETSCSGQHYYPDHVYVSRWVIGDYYYTHYSDSNSRIKFELDGSLISASLRNDNLTASEVRPVNIPVNFFIYCE